MGNSIKGDVICASCGTIGVGKKVGRYKGSFLMELFIWLAMLVFAPFTAGLSLMFALGYSIWRLTGSSKKVCTECGSGELVPVTSPRGEKLVKEMGYVEE